MTPFSAIFVPEELREAVSDRAWLQGMLDAESALAKAGAALGLVPKNAAARIGDACRAELYDPARLARDGRAVGNPAEPLVRELRAAAGDEAADYVHLGATSQDIVDTAAMLVSRRATALVLAELDRLAEGCAALARTHRSTPMTARTLLQQAVPTTFGLKAAGWLVAVLEARGRLAAVRDERLAAQLGGAAGTLAALGGDALEVVRLYAEELGLAEPVLPWHTNRQRLAELGAALDGAAGAAAKVGRDIVLLAQTEVGEVAEASGGRSSTMPQKRNPVRSTLAIACARLTNAHAGVLLGELAHEHERAVGGWHAEWEALSGALAFAGGAAAAAADARRRPRGRRRADAREPRREWWHRRRRAHFVRPHSSPRAQSGARRRRRGRERCLVPRGAPRRRADGSRRGRPGRAPRADRLSRRGRGARRPGARRAREVAKVNLSYRLEGPDDAPVLVLSNSLGTTQELWERQASVLADRFRLLTYDHPGHGGSELPEDESTVEHFADGLLALLDELGLERVSLCGVSLGGMVGMALALDAPERVERLVLACTSAYLGPPHAWAERARIARTEGVEAIAETVVGRWFTPEFVRDEPETVARFRAMLTATPPEGYARCCEAVGAWDARERISAIAAPVLVVAGAEDPATPVEHAELIASRIPGARLQVLERAAHLANVERADAFTSAVLEHLGQEVHV